MGLNINFYLESRKGNTKNLPINILVGFYGQRLKYYTGFRIDSDKWNKVKQEVYKNNVNEEGLTASHINQKLSTLKADAARIYNHYDTSDVQITIEIFRKELKEANNKTKKTNEENALKLSECIDKYINAKNASIGTIKMIKVLFNHFNKFLKFDKPINSINSQIINEFEDYLINIEKKGRNTVVSNMKRLRTFFFFAKDKDWLELNPFDKVKIKPEIYGNPIVMTKEEFDHLHNTNLKNKPALDKTRDIFIFQCCIGCRVSDLMRLSKKNIIHDKIEYIPAKTKNEEPSPVSVTLNDKATQILEKYSEMYKSSDDILPKISSVNYNIHLKELFYYCELNRTIIQQNPKTGAEESITLASIASSHLARRTFISILHKNDVKDSVIASMSGHKPNSKAFTRYYLIDDEQKKKAVNYI